MPVMTQDLLNSGMTQAQIDAEQAANEAQFQRLMAQDAQIKAAMAANDAKAKAAAAAIPGSGGGSPGGGNPLAAQLPGLPEGAAKMGLTALGILGGVGIMYLLFRSPPKKGAAGGKPLAKAGDYRRSHRFTRRWRY